MERHELVVLSHGNEADTITIDDRRNHHAKSNNINEKQTYFFWNLQRAMAQKPRTHILSLRR